MKISKLVLLAAFCLPLCSFGSIHQYRLFDHPDANQAPPPYGLRLDNVFDGYGYDGVTTFSFNSGVVMAEVDDVAGTMRIFGDIYGGVDVGEAYGLEVKVRLDFTYSDMVMADNFDPTDPDLQVPQGEGGGGIEVLDIISDPTDGGSNGLVGQTFQFHGQSQSQRRAGLRRRLQFPEHRASRLRWLEWLGWVELASVYGGTHDFLFIGELVPEPGSLAIWSMIGVVFCSRRRRTF